MILDINSKIITGRTKKDSVSSNMKKKSRRILIVADPSAEQSLINTVSEDFERKGAECVVFSEIPPKPTSRIIENLSDMILKGYIEAVVGIGGLKTLNIAKTAAAAAKSGISIDDILDKQSVSDLDSDIDYIEIPTSMRNPLMFSPYSTVVDSRNRSVKYIDTGIMPSLVISDPDFCDSLSKTIFESVVFELVLYALEGSASLKKSYFSDSINKCALKEILGSEYGLKSDRASETAVSVSLAQAATGPGAGFFLSSYINSRSSVPRAVISVILMPWILEWYFKRYPVLIETVNEVIPVEETMNSEDFLQYLRKKISMKGIPLRLSETGVTKDIFPYVVSSIDQLNQFTSLPAEIAEDEAEEILKKAY